MGRRRLTEAERAEGRRAAWERIQHGRPNPDGARGDPDEWVRRFRTRVGLDAAPPAPPPALEAERYFGLSARWGLGDLRRAFRRRMLAVHPDRGGTDAEAQRCIEFYERLRGVMV